LVTPEKVEEIDYQILKGHWREIYLSGISKLPISHGGGGKVLLVEIRGKISAGGTSWSFKDSERGFGKTSTHLSFESLLDYAF
jgi:hypothetical protein